MASSVSNYQLSFRFAVKAPIEELWRIIGTAEGLAEFFSPDLNVEMKPGGVYEFYFDPGAPRGSRGSEGMRILALEEGRSYSFSWNNPPSLPEIRNEETHCQFILHPLKDNRTEVLFIQSGFGIGDSWKKSRAYFRRAWGDIVLPRLRYRAEQGPLDWENLPDLRLWSLNRRFIEDPRGRLTVRTAGEEDLELLLEMVLGLRRDEQMDNDVSNEELIESLGQRIQGDSVALIFQDREGKTVGYTLSDPTASPLYLAHLFVLPEQRKKGYGKDLMDLTLDYFQASELDLYVLSWNTRAQEFYKHLGLREREKGLRYSRTPDRN